MSVTSAITPAGGHNPPRLRDLSEADFRAAYDSDRFTAIVLSNRLRYVVQHMSTGLSYSAFSPIIRDWYDFYWLSCDLPGLNLVHDLDKGAWAMREEPPEGASTFSFPTLDANDLSAALCE